MADPGAVTVAYVHSNEVAHSWHRSLIELVGHDLANEGRVLRGGWLAMRCGTDGLPAARNETVKTFLADRDADWLFWVDTDMGFSPDVVDRLLEVADPVERPIVGGLCFIHKEHTPDGMGGQRCFAAPTIFDWVQIGEGDGKGFMGRANYPINTVVRCAGTGSACILIHRSVLEQIQAKYGDTWYDRVPSAAAEGSQLIGEDLSFCLRAGSLRIPIFVHTGVKTTHFKEFWLAEQDFWERSIPPPATEEVAVIVPVMKRPQNAAPFMQSLRASTGLATVYAICDRSDTETMAAWRREGAEIVEVVDPEPGSFAEKVNIGRSCSTEPWLFLVGDDVRFHAGWLDHAQAVAKMQDASVVGTNDLGTPRVTSGEHATHLLIRRDYIDSQGASWDGPGTVAHESYRHWFVDDEAVLVAKQRGVWSMALGSVVEHMHPYFGRGEMDEVYRLGESHAEADRALFEQRCRKFLAVQHES